MFDLSDLDTPIPPTKSNSPNHYWMCTACQHISITAGTCNTCQAKTFIPFLDRRPLLLTKEVCNGVISLINDAADSLLDMEIDDSIICTNEYMPFLSKLLKDSKLAEERKSRNESGWRVSTLSSSEHLSLFSLSQIPPSEKS